MWYVVQYKPNQGKRALANLGNQGISCFFPQIYVDKFSHGKRVQRHEALFPGYMFVELGCDDPAWSKVRSTRGVQKVVGFSGTPLPIENSVIEQVKEGLAALGEQPSIRAGDKVIVSDGPFKGLPAVFGSFDGEQRAMVLVRFMQQQCKVVVPLSVLSV